MLDRLDDALEPLARLLTGKIQWDEMKENALRATEGKDGGARMTISLMAELVEKFGDDLEIHLVAHSAGSILMAPLIRLLTSNGTIAEGYLNGDTGPGLKVRSCTLWAPACTIDLFKKAYLPSIKNKTLEKFAIFTLTEKAEQDDHCAHIYNKSLLYLVSNALEEKQRIPFTRKDGIPLLGIQKFVERDEHLTELKESGELDLVTSPNAEVEGSPFHSTARSHGAFDDDKATLNATLARILGVENAEKEFVFNRSASSLQDRRMQLTTGRNG
jgi:hypothetical protein